MWPAPAQVYGGGAEAVERLVTIHSHATAPRSGGWLSAVVRGDQPRLACLLQRRGHRCPVALSPIFSRLSCPTGPVQQAVVSDIGTARMAALSWLRPALAVIAPASHRAETAWRVAQRAAAHPPSSAAVALVRAGPLWGVPPAR